MSVSETFLVIALSALAAARTYRLLAIDGAGRYVRNKLDGLVWRITPKPMRATVMYPRRKDWTKWEWRRYSFAKSLTDGYYCSHCSPFWYGAAWLGTGILWHESWIWVLFAGSFAGSYISGHLGARLDSGSADDD